MMAYERPPIAIIGRVSQGVTGDPKSLEGKTLGAPPPDAAFGQWPAFAEVAGLDTSTITIENVGFPVREPMLAQGQVDAIFGYSFSSVLNLKAQGIPADDISTILMPEHGLDIYGNVVMVNTDFAKEHPDAVKGVVRALVRGYLDAIADPAAAIPHVLERNGVLDEATEVERLQMAVDGSIATPAVKANGFGGVDMDKLAKSMEFLKISMGVSDTPPAPERVFDASFLPPVEERMVK
jgi:NitT/TauT family transport system substrate-binding protein